MHTDQRDREERVHSSYEDAVDRRVGDYRFNYARVDPAKRPAQDEAPGSQRTSLSLRAGADLQSQRLQPDGVASRSASSAAPPTLRPTS